MCNDRGRFLGYAGLSAIPTIPCFFVSVSAVRRIIRLHRDNQRTSFKNDVYRLPSLGGRIASDGPPEGTIVHPMMASSSQSLGMKADEVIPDGSDLSLPAAMLLDEWTEPWQAVCTIEDEQTGRMSSCEPPLVRREWVQADADPSNDTRCTAFKAESRPGNLAANSVPDVSRTRLWGTWADELVKVVFHYSMSCNAVDDH